MLAQYNDLQRKVVMRLSTAMALLWGKGVRLRYKE